jgi:hypothetical protein
MLRAARPLPHFASLNAGYTLSLLSHLLLRRWHESAVTREA